MWSSVLEEGLNNVRELQHLRSFACFPLRLLPTITWKKSLRTLKKMLPCEARSDGDCAENVAVLYKSQTMTKMETVVVLG